MGKPTKHLVVSEQIHDAIVQESQRRDVILYKLVEKIIRAGAKRLKIDLPEK
jgi:hypothetical protein